MTARAPMSDEIDYLTDPTAIYRQSFATIRAETDLSRLSDGDAEIAVRVIHACGMTDIVDDLRFFGDVRRAAGNALAAGAPIFADCTMAASAIIRRNLPNENEVVCTLGDPRTPARAKAIGVTRSAAAVEFWRDRLSGAVVVIGNAPTALFALIELIETCGPRPAAIIAFPVGFVGAVESKRLLVERELGVPYVTLLGRRGGSAMAGAALNAVLVGAKDQ